MAFLCACSGLPNEEDNNGNSHEGNGNPEEDVTARSLCPDDNHPHAIDLGIGLKWSCCNVGASAPWEYGGYYAWGETEEKENYNPDTYKWFLIGDRRTITKYNYQSSSGIVDNKTVLDAADDVAYVKLGGKWRMPTYSEIDELISTRDKTSYQWNWKTVNGHNGWLVTYLVNNKSIFLPATGIVYEDSLYNEGSSGNYWSSSLDTDDPYNPDYAFALLFGPSDVHRNSLALRMYGRSIRPVSE